MTMKKIIYAITFGVFLSLFFLSSCERDKIEKDNKRPNNEKDSVLTPTFPPMDNSIVFDDRKANENLAQLLSQTDPVATALSKGRVEINDEQLQEIKEFTDQLVKDAKDNTEKYKIINKWVTSNIRYGNGNNHAYAVFKNRVGVCQGYSNLLKIMLLTQKIPAFIANGTYSGIGHAWNYMYLNKNKWIVVDATNKVAFRIQDFTKYRHLRPLMIDITLFSDKNFDYTFYNHHLTVIKVKNTKDENIVLPVSVAGFRVTEFNPTAELPSQIKNIYLGENIVSLGQDNNLGLNFKGQNIEGIYVAPKNKKFKSVKKILYKNDDTNLPYYIPAQLKRIELLPIENIGKNTIYNHDNVVEIVFAKGTKNIGAYAVENCQKLERVYIPKETKIEKNAFYKVGDIEIIRTEE